jgi:hypothetical protein
VKAEAELPHSKKRTGNLGLPVGPKFITGSLRFESFLHLRELQLCFRQGFHDKPLRVFGSEVASGGHFTDQEILGPLEHFLFAEGERLATAEGNQTFEDDGDFEEGTGAHALGIFLEAVFPVVMGIELAFFEEAKDFACVGGADDGSKTNRRRIGLRDHDSQTADNNADHVVPFSSAVQHPVIDLLDNSNTMVRINDFVANLIVHSFGSPP